MHHKETIFLPKSVWCCSEGPEAKLSSVSVPARGFGYQGVPMSQCERARQSRTRLHRVARSCAAELERYSADNDNKAAL